MAVLSKHRLITLKLLEHELSLAIAAQRLPKLLKLYKLINSHLVKAKQAEAKALTKKDALAAWLYQIELMGLKERLGAYLYALTGTKDYVMTSIGEQMAANIKQHRVFYEQKVGVKD